MFRSLFASSTKRYLKMWIGLTAGMFAFQLLMAGIFESFAPYFETSGFAGQSMPEVFNVFTGGASWVDPIGWLGTGYAHPIPLILILAWTIVTSASSIAKEVEDGTAEMMFSRPVPRGQVLSARITHWLIGLFGILAAGYLGTMLGIQLGGGLETVSQAQIWALVLSYLPIASVCAGIGFAISSAVSVRSLASSITVAFAVGSYFLNFAAQLWEPINNLTKLSIFSYSVPADWAMDGVPYLPAFLMTLAGVLLLFSAFIILSRRNIAP